MTVKRGLVKKKESRVFASPGPAARPGVAATGARWGATSRRQLAESRRRLRCEASSSFFRAIHFPPGERPIRGRNRGEASSAVPYTELHDDIHGTACCRDRHRDGRAREGKMRWAIDEDGTNRSLVARTHLKKKEEKNDATWPPICHPQHQHPNKDGSDSAATPVGSASPPRPASRGGPGSPSSAARERTMLPAAERSRQSYRDEDEGMRCVTWRKKEKKKK